MTRHLIDHPKTAPSERLMRFLRLERAAMPGQRSKALMLRLQHRSSDRLKAYTRIARGVSA
ncbi:MAG: hypothetical protein EA339_12160 [Rhodobacteraceae bacterium]|nr:MAG: hypothetical protein EA339_12160 [Paracoccaceae bacterium]